MLVPRKLIGSAVTHAYLARPELRISVVPTHSAIEPSNWFAMPNIGQIVLMLPVQMKYPQPRTIRTLDDTLANSQSGRAKGG